MKEYKHAGHRMHIIKGQKGGGKGVRVCAVVLHHADYSNETCNGGSEGVTVSCLFHYLSTSHQDIVSACSINSVSYYHLY